MTPGFYPEKLEFHSELQLTKIDKIMEETDLRDKLRIWFWMFNLKCHLRFRCFINIEM